EGPPPGRPPVGTGRFGRPGRAAGPQRPAIAGSTGAACRWRARTCLLTMTHHGGQRDAFGGVWLPSYNGPRRSPMGRKEPFRNNARLVLAVTAAATFAFVAFEVLLRKSRDFSPDFLASVFLYGLTVLNLSLLLVLLFVLGRNLVRVLMERRRRVLGARFRMRLVLIFLLMAIAPSLLLIVVGSDLIRQTVDRWFNVDVERILSSTQALGTALRTSVLENSRTHARVLAR